MQGTTAGAIVKRAGWHTLVATSANPTSVFAPTQSSALLIFADATHLYSYISGTTTTLKSSLTSGAWQFVRGPVVSSQGPTYGMNGSDTPQQWNEAAGTTSNWTATDSGGTVPNGKYCLYHQNQVYVTGVTGSPSRLYWSGIADPTAWNPANLNGSGFMDFDPNDGQTITGIGTVGPYLIVFKQHKTFILISAATAQARRLSDRVGCTGHRTIAEGSEGTYFLAPDGVVYLTNGSKLTPISDKITPTILAGTWSTAVYHNRHYYLSGLLSGGAVTLDWDARLDSWWKHTIGAADWTLANDATYGWIPLAANTGQNFISQAFADQTNWQDNGANFTWQWFGPWQSPTFYRRRRFPTTFFRKRLRQIRLDGAGTVDLSVAKDFSPAATLVRANIFSYPPSGTGTFAGSGIYGAADGSLFGGGGTNLPARIYGQGVARAFSLVLSSTSNTADMLTSYTLVITDRRDSLVA